ncbi:MAG: hypothetical protein RIM84_05115 [Alphaproteobacteria bacterium]
MIEALGLPVVEGTPVCLPVTDVGDAKDHVAPPLKADYTLHYYRLLQRHEAAGR